MPDLGSTSFSQTDSSNDPAGSAAPNTIDNNIREIKGAVTREWNHRSYTVTAGGTADAKTLTYSVAPDAYRNGQRYAFIANTTNTGSCTVNVNALGAKTVKSMLTGKMSGGEVDAAFDAVVTGVRAFNVRESLSPHLAGLFAWVEQGGTVITQYNRPGRDIKTDRLAPFALTLGGNDARVTDEDAAITLLEPNHPAFNVPNKLTPADWTGWVQERGAYFGTTWGPQFTPLLACNDAGEKPQRGGLLVARHGQGYYVYTGLGFFRQLPAGVPGAYRLFANLISLGKK
jgi:hypothetical protein